MDAACVHRGLLFLPSLIADLGRLYGVATRPDFDRMGVDCRTAAIFQKRGKAAIPLSGSYADPAHGR